MEDAQRFLVTTKSNGENGKYTFRRVFGEWYAFAGSKNTGYCWRLFGTKATDLYPIPELDAIAGVGPKIISFVDETISSMEEKQREELLENVQKKGCVTVMVELNDETHEHIFPIDRSWVDHVAILNRQGLPWPQHDAYAFFDTYGLRRVKMEAYGMERLSGVMDEIRQSTDTEGAVLYLERSDGLAVGLVKVKSDHYVIARRTREILRSLVKASEAGGVSTEMLRKVEKKLKEGMAALSHVGGCSEKHSEWSKTAVAFTKSWADAYESADSVVRKALAVEFHCKYGSMYERFWRTGSESCHYPASVCRWRSKPALQTSTRRAWPPQRPRARKGRRKRRAGARGASFGKRPRVF
ncbi:unnamed protein product [Effrenium voratum]|nr:unnamed protein product [Effrenium voratum]